MALLQALRQPLSLDLQAVAAVVVGGTMAASLSNRSSYLIAG